MKEGRTIAVKANTKEKLDYYRLKLNITYDALINYVFLLFEHPELKEKFKEILMQNIFQDEGNNGKYNQR